LLLGVLLPTLAGLNIEDGKVRELLKPYGFEIEAFTVDGKPAQRGKIVQTEPTEGVVMSPGDALILVVESDEGGGGRTFDSLPGIESPFSGLDVVRDTGGSPRGDVRLRPPVNPGLSFPFRPRE